LQLFFDGPSSFQREEALFCWEFESTCNDSRNCNVFIKAFPAERIAIHLEFDLLELLCGGGRQPVKPISWKTYRPAIM
jgi:hypothetical protein